jgi:flagellar protein FlaJ
MALSMLEKLGIGEKPKQLPENQAIEALRAKSSINKKQLRFDLFTHVSYMASLATAKASREVMFTRAAKLNLASTPFFAEINTLVHRLKYDYSEACRAVADRTDIDEVSSLLIRMSGSLSSGEDEEEFLTREAAVMSELYQAEYEQKIESLRKWTDAYAALIVSAGLIVVISMISMMIWSLGPIMILMTALSTIGVMATGAFILNAAAPVEGFTRKAGLSAVRQIQARRMMMIFGAGGAVAGALALLSFGIGPALIISGLGLVPGGFIMYRDQSRIGKEDADIATATRLLGGITDAIGSTVGDALTKVDRRSLASLEPYFRRLDVRIRASLSPDLAWKRLVQESGSEMVERTVNIFWDALTIGGNALLTGKNAAFFASNISILRQKRGLVANTFTYLVIPLHMAMTGLLVFIMNVMQKFAGELNRQTAPDLSATGAQVPDIANVAGFNTFANVDFAFLNILVTAVILALTLANAIAPYSASGGHRFRLLMSLGVMMIISGAMLTLIPPMADVVFATITAPATSQ